MIRVRARRVELDALQFTGENIDEIDKFTFGNATHVESAGQIQIPSVQGVITAWVGWWILRNMANTFLVMSPEEFEAHYVQIEVDD